MTKIKLRECVAMVGQSFRAGQVISWPDDAAAQRMIDSGIAVLDQSEVLKREAAAEAEAEAVRLAAAAVVASQTPAATDPTQTPVDIVVVPETAPETKDMAPLTAKANKQKMVNLQSPKPE
jgi:hypothetical protein